MKKILTILVAAAVLLMCVPLFAGCKGVTSYVLNTDEDGNKYYTVKAGGYTANLGGVVEIPEYYGEGEDYAPVTKIADKAFAGTSVKGVVIPKTITEIGTAAFAYNSSLTSVTFAEDCEIDKISWGCFVYCESLQKIVLPSSVTQIEGMAFYNCTNLNDITLPDGLLTIGREAFENCTALRQITLPQTLTTIGALAFYYSGLYSIVIPDSVHDIVTQSENEDEEPSVLPGIGLGAFHTCEYLETAVIGSGTTVLRSGVFGYCPALKEVYLPAELEQVEGAYFSGTSMIYGYPFHNTGITDVYYAGTEEQWSALLQNIDDTSYTEQGVVFSNAALINATVHCETLYSE